MRPWYVIAVGRALGEAAVAARFSKIAREQGQTVVGWSESQRNRRFICDVGGVASRSLPDPAGLLVAAQVEEPAVVVLSNSLTCHPYPPAFIGWRGLVVSLETNWQPWFHGWASVARRLDRVFVMMPDSVWRAGYQAQGGPFLEHAYMHRAVAVGWPCDPVATQYDDPVVYIYLGSGTDADELPYARNLGRAIELTAARHPELRWVYHGRYPIWMPDFVDRRPGWVDDEELLSYWANAQLVVGHGMVTLSQAACQGIPVLALEKDSTFYRPARCAWGEQEILSLARSGLVSTCPGVLPAESLARRMQALLARGRWPVAESSGLVEAVLGIEAMLEDTRRWGAPVEEASSSPQPAVCGSFAALARHDRLEKYRTCDVHPVDDEVATSMHRVHWLRGETADRPFRRVLDIACADGFVTRWLVDQPGFEWLVGLDAGEQAIVRARMAVLHRRHPEKAVYVCGDYRLYQAEQTFDGVWCSEFIEHLPGEEAAGLLRFMQASLAPAGRALLCTPNRHGRWGMNNPDPQHICLYGRDELLDLIQEILSVEAEVIDYHDGCDFLLLRWQKGIEASTAPAQGLEPDKLSEEELRELHSLSDLRQSLLEQSFLVEQRMEMLILTARDRRGLHGRVRVNRETGMLMALDVKEDQRT